MLGEPVSLMFIILGTVILSFKENFKYNIYLAGFLFSLACHTKLISLFAVCGILSSWFFLSICYERFNEAFKKLIKIFLVILFSFAFFEFYKLIILGYQEYFSSAKETIHFNKSMAFGSISIGERLSMFSRIINQVYLTPLIVFFLCNMFCISNYIKNKKDMIQSSNLKCSLFLFFGSNFYFIYVIFFSVLMPRYLWIGYYLLILSMLFILFTKHKLFTTLIFSIFFGLLVNIYFFSNSSFSSVYSYENKNKMHKNRLKIVEQINTYTSTPFLAEQWMSIYDLIYINNKKISWAMNDSINIYKDKEFIGIFNTTFTSKNLPFSLALQSSCKLLAPEYGQFRLYSCGLPFWNFYYNLAEKKFSY